MTLPPCHAHSTHPEQAVLGGWRPKQSHMGPGKTTRWHGWGAGHSFKGNYPGWEDIFCSNFKGAIRAQKEQSWGHVDQEMETSLQHQTALWPGGHGAWMTSRGAEQEGPTTCPCSHGRGLHLLGLSPQPTLRLEATCSPPFPVSKRQECTCPSQPKNCTLMLL